jgi:hypothetical protein
VRGAGRETGRGGGGWGREGEREPVFGIVSVILNVLHMNWMVNLLMSSRLVHECTIGDNESFEISNPSHHVFHLVLWMNVHHSDEIVKLACALLANDLAEEIFVPVITDALPLVE